MEEKMTTNVLQQIHLVANLLKFRFVESMADAKSFVTRLNEEGYCNSIGGIIYN
jgi:hypothetical protein